MRLSERQQQLIHETVLRVCGPTASVWLFGSRTDDALQGGDIDLLVEVDPMPDEVFPSRRTRLSRELRRTLGQRKIDLLFAERGYPRTAFQRLVLQHAIPL